MAEAVVGEAEATAAATEEGSQPEDYLPSTRWKAKSEVEKEAAVAAATPASTTTTTTTTTATTATTDLLTAAKTAVIPNAVLGAAAPLELLENQRCEVRKASGVKKQDGPDEDLWQAAVVVRRLPGHVYRVRRLCDDVELEASAPAKEVRRMGRGQGVRVEALKPGMRLRARFSGDGEFYPATVDRRTEHGCVVTFEGYGNSEHVAVEHVQLGPASLPSASAGAAATTSTSASTSTGTTTEQPHEDGGKEKSDLPKHLVVLPTDPDHIKEKKQRQLKQYKRKLAMEASKTVEQDRLSSWQAFQATAKRAKGALTTVGAHSQFSVGADPDAKVGVVRPSGAPPPPSSSSSSST